MNGVGQYAHVRLWVRNERYTLPFGVRAFSRFCNAALRPRHRLTRGAYPIVYLNG